MELSVKKFFNKCDQNPQFTADMLAFTEEISIGKLYFVQCTVKF